MSDQKGNLTELKFYVARQHDQQQSKYYFEPCYPKAFLTQKINIFVKHRSLRLSSGILVLIFYCYQVTMRLII